MPKRPDQQTIRQMLNDVEAVTKARFYPDPNPVSGPIEMFRIPDGKSGGEPFSSLFFSEKAQVLGDYTRWSEYEERGVTSDQFDRVVLNVCEGNPRERWLEGTGLESGKKMTMADLRALGKELAQDAALAKAEQEQRRRVEKFGSIEQEEAALKREKDNGMER